MKEIILSVIPAILIGITSAEKGHFFRSVFLVLIAGAIAYGINTGYEIRMDKPLIWLEYSVASLNGLLFYSETREFDEDKFFSWRFILLLIPLFMLILTTLWTFF